MAPGTATRIHTARRVLRLAVLTLCLLTLLSAGHSVVTYDAATRGATPTATDPAVVVAIDGVGPGQLVAFDTDGNLAYHDAEYWLYHDVDPSPAGEHSVSYVATDIVDSDRCAGQRCLRNVIERANLSTGDVTTLHDWVVPGNGSAQIHDVERMNESVFLIADISFPDRVYAVDTDTGEERWEWRVSEAYDPGSGGAYPGDWTHVNDVETLPDGRVMVNLRNQDQVVFLNPGRGVQSNWTFGTDDAHGTLYEPHNPDYIPSSRGGPAIVVADSENNRLVEYQRVNDSWVRSWHWQDTTLQWPRDADRLPSGRTLVADSHGQRILSVGRRGQVVWERSFPPGSYDVELLGTGSESTGGDSARALGLRSRWPGSSISDPARSMGRTVVGPGRTGNLTGPAAVGPSGSGATPAPEASVSGGPQSGVGQALSTLRYRIVALVPSLVLHGLLWALPAWASAGDAVLVLATAIVGAIWVTSELAVAVATLVAGRRD